VRRRLVVVRRRLPAPTADKLLTPSIPPAGRRRRGAALFKLANLLNARTREVAVTGIKRL
jgi:hypothetical protein